MKICVIHSGTTGVDYHRLIVPFARIANTTDIVVMSANQIEDATFDELKSFELDAIIYSRNISYKFDPAPILFKVRAAGIKIIIDIDDYWEVPNTHPLKSFSTKTNLSKCITDQIFFADAVITTHSELRKEIGKIRPTKRVYIAPNGIDPNEEQFTHSLLSYDYESVFWQGGSTHYNDLKLLHGAFKDLLDYKFTMAGYYPCKEWDDCAALFNRDNFEYEPTRQIIDYAINYYNKGICVVPLLNNKFNRLKSELKVIEAGWFQKPVIASGIHPYTRIIERDVNGLFADTKQDWAKKIKGLLSNKQWQDDLRFKLHETVKQRYLIDKVNEGRLECLYDTVKR